MMKKILPFVLLFIAENVFSQCTVTGSTPQDTIVCGQRILLSAYGQGQGVEVLSEDFNNGTYGPGWSSTQQAMWNNPCGPNTIDGTTYIWMGNSSPVPRILTTAVFDLSSCAAAGVTICYDMRYAVQGDAAPCEGPDLPTEGVYLQYSTDGGTTWNTIHYTDPNGGDDPQLTTWNQYCYQVPLAALTATTQFRWYQDNDSGADYDHWGIDNVAIYCNDPTYNIVWQQDNYSLGPSGGTDPNAVAPHTTTTYYVVMSNGTTTCRDSVRVVVKNPTLVVDAGNDTSVCNGQCAQLHATAKVIESPAKIATYSDNTLQQITTGLGQVTDIPISVTGLNMGTVLPNSITEVCVDNIFFFGTSIFPPAQIDISDLILTLICPDGTSVILVPANVTTGGSNPLTGGYNNTCFVPAGANIATGTPPYSGSWAPNQPFNNFVGCTANGIWTLDVTMNTALGFGAGTFSGWHITFNDPEISYTGNFNWSPTTNMSNSTTLTPTVCPPPNAYTLTVSDTANCVTLSDVVNVTTHSCCGLSAFVSTVQPSCGSSNGSINVTPSPGSYSYAWNDGVATQNRTNIAAGTYCVTITDNNTPTCTFDTCIVLNSNSTLNVSFTNPVNPTCAGNDGSITVNLSGGASPYNVTVDTGGAPITFPPIPFPISQAVPGLPAGSVTVSVTDAAGCISTATATLTAPANCCTFTVTDVLVQPDCASSNGSITLTSANGSGNYSYSWAGGLGSSNSVSGLAAGIYFVTITDNAFANCEKDTFYTLTNPNAPTTTIAVTGETCAGTDDGAITVNTSGGNPPLTISWSTSATTFTISNLTSGNYDFTVTDASGCSTNGSAMVVTGNSCCPLRTSVTVVPPACGDTTGTITVNIDTAGFPPYSYSIDGINFQASNIFIGVPSGNYLLTTQDANNCFDTQVATIPQGGTDLILFVSSNDISCFDAGDGIISATSTNGNAPFAYVWNNGDTNSTILGAAAGNYTVTVTDQTGCTGTGSGSITEPAPLTVDLGNDVSSCEGQTIILDPGNGFDTYEWSTNETTQTIEPSVSGNYSVTVTDIDGCTATDNVNVNVNIGTSTTVDLGDARFAVEGDHVGLFANVNQGNGGNGSYNWQPDTLLSCANCQNTVAYAYNTITYTVLYTDPSGCSASDTVTIYVQPLGNIFWPNAFSPNGDGNNDIYIPYGSTVKQIDWQVFNRWGEKVFESNNFNYGWDGTYKGQLLPMGVYVYTAKVVMLNDAKREFKGSFTLIR